MEVLALSLIFLVSNKILFKRNRAKPEYMRSMQVQPNKFRVCLDRTYFTETENTVAK